MKLVFASDSFKGSLSSVRIGALLETAAREVFPHAECIVLPIADGGEGTLDAISSVRGGSRATLQAHDGLMRPIGADVFLCGDEAFVEAASTCGLTLLADSERDPLATSSFGVGECIRFALERGCGRITVGLGGSCTNDGGMGCLRALGVRFFDCEGRELAGCGADLERVARIDAGGLCTQAREVSFTVMNDVDNPLLGANGATHVFGPQKGADGGKLERLEAGMANFARVIAAHGQATEKCSPPERAGGANSCAREHSPAPSPRLPEGGFATPGFGAAGGLGMALAVFLGAQMRSGIEELLRWIDFDRAAAGADLMVTGEGKLDGQSIQGKAVSGIAAHAARLGVPVVALCGSVALDDQAVRDAGISRAIDISAGQTLEYAMAHAEQNYLRAARALFSSL